MAIITGAKTVIQEIGPQDFAAPDEVLEIAVEAYVRQPDEEKYLGLAFLHPQNHTKALTHPRLKELVPDKPDGNLQVSMTVKLVDGQPVFTIIE
ncbi:MAG: hypothetical protein WCT37_05065 [Patescibacteria group bacterium]|jgi:hypothetical protein